MSDVFNMLLYAMGCLWIYVTDPVMTVSADSSDVYFNNCGFSNVDSGICVIQVTMTVVRHSPYQMPHVRLSPIRCMVYYILISLRSWFCDVEFIVVGWFPLPKRTLDRLHLHPIKNELMHYCVLLTACQFDRPETLV